MVSMWEKSYGDRAKAWDCNTFDLCWTSPSKALTTDKGKSGPKEKVICSGLLEAGMNSIYSDNI